MPDSAKDVAAAPGVAASVQDMQEDKGDELCKLSLKLRGTNSRSPHVQVVSEGILSAGCSRGQRGQNSLQRCLQLADWHSTCSGIRALAGRQ